MLKHPPLAAATCVARLAADQATARRVGDALAEILQDQGVATAAYEGKDGRWSLAIHFPEPPNQTAVRALIALAAGAKLANAVRFETVAQQDWVKASLEGLAPVAAGRFLVHGQHDRARVPPNRIGIEIEAALAFGTGHHGTTRGCLLALDRLVTQQRIHLSPRAGRGRPSVTRSGEGVLRSSTKVSPPHPNPLPASGAREKTTRRLRILDVGTGSGVLAIAAARALRRPVLASDIDPLAVRIARENARLNKTGALVQVIHAGGLNAGKFRQHGPFDIVLANILLGPLQQLARPMRRLLAPDARVILSGLLPSHANAALAAYRAQGLVLERRLILDGWATLVLRRPALPS